MSKNSGQWQAQGDDIGGKGHCVEWGQDAVPTKQQGLTWLGQVEAACAHKQRERRAGSFRDARRFVQRAPPGGYPSTSRHFYADDDRYPDARVDLEIYGMAFCG